MGETQANTTTAAATTTIKVATTQIEPVWFDLEGTVKKTIDLIGEASHNGAQLIAFPEVWIPGYPGFVWLYNFTEQRELVKKVHDSALTVDSPEFLRIRRAARDGAIYVLLGFAEKVGGTLYMSQALLGPTGDVLFHHQKMKPTHMERTIFGDGKSELVPWNVVKTPIGNVGALMCWEHLQPLIRHHTLAQNEQIHISSWPVMANEKEGEWTFSKASAVTTQGYAMESSTFVLSSTQVHTSAFRDVYKLRGGTAGIDALPGGGFAAIYAPDGRKLTEDVAPDWEGILYADIDLGECTLHRNLSDPAGNYSRPDVFQFVVHPDPAQRKTKSPPLEKEEEEEGFKGKGNDVKVGE